MELGRSPEGRLEGRVSSDVRTEPVEFSGILELLKVLEEFPLSIDPQGVHDE
jgi:hypothetical protein